MRFRKTITLTIAVAMACVGLSGCGQSSADTAKTFMDAVAAGDAGKVESMLVTSDMGVAQAKPAKPITDVTIGEASDDNRIPVSYKVDGTKETVETELSMQKADGGWRVLPTGILSKFEADDELGETTVGGTKVDNGTYMLPGVYEVHSEDDWADYTWNLTSLGKSKAVGAMDGADEAVTEFKDGVKTAPEVLDAVRDELLSDVKTCPILKEEMLNGRTMTFFAGDSIAGACSGNGVVNADGVTVAGYETDPDGPSKATLTLGGTLVGNKPTFRNVTGAERYELKRSGWTCQTVSDIDADYQCAMFGDGEFSADGLKVTVAAHPKSLDVSIPDDTVQAIADILYEGHGVD